MKTRTAMFVAVSVALGLASPALFAQGAKPPVTNPSAAKAKGQASEDDLLAGRKSGPGAAKKGSAQMGSGQGQQGPGQRKMEAKAHKGDGQGQQGFGGQRKAQMGDGQGQQGFGGQRKAQAQGQGQGQEPNTPQTARKAQMGDGQGQQGFGGQRQMQSKGGLSGGGDQMHKGGAASQSKAAQMHK